MGSWRIAWAKSGVIESAGGDAGQPVPPSANGKDIVVDQRICQPLPSPAHAMFGITMKRPLSQNMLSFHDVELVVGGQKG